MDIAIASALSRSGYKVAKIDSSFESDIKGNIGHSPDTQMMRETYPLPVQNRWIGHQLIFCNDGNGNDGGRLYSVENEFDNLDCE